MTVLPTALLMFIVGSISILELKRGYYDEISGRGMDLIIYYSLFGSILYNPPRNLRSKQN